MTLYNHYKLNFDVTQYHNFSITELNDMIPFEREVYIDLLLEKKEKEKSNNNQTGFDFDSEFQP